MTQTVTKAIKKREAHKSLRKQLTEAIMTIPGVQKVSLDRFEGIKRYNRATFDLKIDGKKVVTNATSEELTFFLTGFDVLKNFLVKKGSLELVEYKAPEEPVAEKAAPAPSPEKKAEKAAEEKAPEAAASETVSPSTKVGGNGAKRPFMGNQFKNADGTPKSPSVAAAA